MAGGPWNRAPPGRPGPCHGILAIHPVPGLAPESQRLNITVIPSEQREPRDLNFRPLPLGMVEPCLGAINTKESLSFGNNLRFSKGETNRGFTL